MKSKFSKQFFPFAPNIPWTIKNNKYIIPGIDANTWEKNVKDKNYIVTCYGGLLESFFSLSYLEALSRTSSGKEIKWMGNPDFEYFVKAQGIGKVNEFDLGSNVVDKYPAPIFMDRENNAYFNVINNYVETKSYKPGPSVTNKDICLKQIFQNCMIPWDGDTPKLRMHSVKKYNEWKSANKFHDNLKYILVFTDKWTSMHDIDCLEWNDRQVRELAEMVRHLGYSVVSCSEKKVDPYYRAGQVIRAPLDIEIVTNLIMNSNGVLSRDIDPLLVSAMISDSTYIISKDVGGIYDLYHNADFIQAKNMIFTETELSPQDVYSFLEDEG